MGSDAPIHRDLSVTALYTSGTWSWASFPGADLLASPEAARVFGVTNVVLRIASLFASGPSLRHSLVQRHALVDHLTRDATDVLELAAGLSRRGTHRSADADVRYVEVDLPHVVERKEELLARTEAGRAVLGRTNFRRVGGDIAELDLEPLLGPDTTVIAEGLLMYLDAPAQQALFRRLVGHRFVFDLVPPAEQPDVGWVGRLLGRVMRVFTGGAGFIEDRRTREDVVADLRAAGFDEVRVTTPEDEDGFDCPHRGERTQTVVFVAR